MHRRRSWQAGRLWSHFLCYCDCGLEAAGEGARSCCILRLMRLENIGPRGGVVRGCPCTAHAQPPPPPPELLREPVAWECLKCLPKRPIGHFLKIFATHIAYPTRKSRPLRLVGTPVKCREKKSAKPRHRQTVDLKNDPFQLILIPL